MNRFWNYWIIVLTTVNVVAMLWLLYMTARKRPGDQAPGEATTGHTWDGDLSEYNNPLPRWWLWGFYFSIAFAVVYLALYPGLGNFAGRLGWTQESAWATDVRHASRESTARLAHFDSMELDELRENTEAMRTARNLFAANCAACHGTDAHGAKGFPNLTDHDWLHGGTAAAITTTLQQGRQGVMPAWGSILGAEGVEQVANYVLSLSGQTVSATLANAGADKFAQTCAACHGVEGRGNMALGSPNLTDNIWLYGGTVETIKETVAKGRTNRMPAHLALLGPTRIKLLTAYVLNLSQADHTPRPNDHDSTEETHHDAARSGQSSH